LQQFKENIATLRMFTLCNCI